MKSNSLGLLLVFFMVLIGFRSSVLAQVITEAVQYKDGEQNLIGYLAMPKDATGRIPTVFVVHEWKGLDDYAKLRTRQLAQQGYLAMAVDIYGDGKTLTTNEEAGKMATAYKADAPKLRGRIQAAYNFLKSHRLFDPKRVAGIGFCFGGTTVLEWARSGAPISGVVSFHGGLATPQPAKAGEVKARILVLHGADDPYVSEAELKAFENEMRSSQADWQMFKYGGAVHGFSRPDGGSDVKSGYAYDQKTDIRSQQAMREFFKEIFSN